MKLIISAIILLLLWGCKSEKRVETPKTVDVKPKNTKILKIEYTYINFVNDKLVLEKYNIYDADTAKTNKRGYIFKTIKQNILYKNSGSKNSAIKRSDFKLLLTLNHLDSNYIGNVHSTIGICPIKYYDDFYILVKPPNKDYAPPFGNQLYHLDTLNVALTKLKYNQTLKEPAEYRPSEVVMYNYSDLVKYRFFISKQKMEFTIGKSFQKMH